MHRRFVLAAIVAAVVSVPLFVPLAITAQAPQQDVLPAILIELRGLRAAMEQMASAGPRVELALGRLQLQEQRVNTLLRRQDSLRDQRTSAERELEQRQLQLKSLGGPRQTTDPHELEMAAQVTAQVKVDVERLTNEIQRLTLEETQLAGDIASEQSRWTSINQQLEDLERNLGRR
jgi:peptidoglycan hydrolase CwlO-like protein